MKLLPTVLWMVTLTLTSRADTIDQLIDAALTNNPAIVAGQARIDAASTLPEQTGALDNPTLKYESDVASQMDTSYEFEQPIPGWGKRHLRTRLAEDDIVIATWDLESTRQSIILQVKEASYRLHAIHQTLSILDEQADVLKQMEALVRSRYTVTTSEQADVLKIASERTMLGQRRLTIDGEEVEWTARLNQALGRPHMDPIPETVVPPIIPLSLDMKRLEAWTMTHNPEYMKSLVMKERSETALAVARRENSPDWMLGAKYQEQEDRDAATVIMIGVELPIWRDRIHATIDQTRHEQDAINADTEVVKRHHVAEVQSMGISTARKEELARVYRNDLLPQAKQRFDATRAAYVAGRGDFLDLLEAERFWLDAQIMSAMADADLRVELANLESILGAPLAAAMSSEAK